MSDYDIYLVPDFKLDNNFNYEIKLILPKQSNNETLISYLLLLDFQVDNNYKITSKVVYCLYLDCFVDIKKWISDLAAALNQLEVKSNLDIINKK